MAYPVVRNTGKLHQFQSWSFTKLSDTFKKVLLGFIPSAPCLKSRYRVSSKLQLSKVSLVTGYS